MSTSSEPQIDKSEILESGQICPVFHPDHNCLFQAEVWAYRHAISRRYAQRTELYENIGSESNLKDGELLKCSVVNLNVDLFMRDLNCLKTHARKSIQNVLLCIVIRTAVLKGDSVDWVKRLVSGKRFPEC